jgi:hypothetical protein
LPGRETTHVTATAALLSRPLHLPHIRPGKPCPLSPPAPHPVRVTVPHARGSGPLYPYIAGGVLLVSPIRGTTLEGAVPMRFFFQKVVWFAPPAFNGVAIVRGGQLDGHHRLFLLRGDHPRLRAVDRLNTDQAGAAAGGWRNWGGYTVVGVPGCYAYQVDGDSFSRIIVFRAVR